MAERQSCNRAIHQPAYELRRTDFDQLNRPRDDFGVADGRVNREDPPGAIQTALVHHVAFVEVVGAELEWDRRYSSRAPASPGAPECGARSPRSICREPDDRKGEDSGAGNPIPNVHSAPPRRSNSRNSSSGCPRLEKNKCWSGPRLELRACRNQKRPISCAEKPVWNFPRPRLSRASGRTLLLEHLDHAARDVHQGLASADLGAGGNKVLVVNVVAGAVAPNPGRWVTTCMSPVSSVSRSI